jgi:hypothetical protein
MRHGNKWGSCRTQRSLPGRHLGRLNTEIVGSNPARDMPLPL